jgi:Bax protein|tara:strand:- start:26 stop:877 length:852 start_codon:yes stop_codon:yes gene_type:complete
MKWLPITFLLVLALPVSAVLYIQQLPPLISEFPAEESPTNGQQDVEQTAGTAVSQPQTEKVPDFSAYLDVTQKKRVFFEFMLPLIREANANIREERSKLIDITTRLETGLVLQRGEHQYLNQLFKRYGMNAPIKVDTQHTDQLLERVDIVPASLVLAQSANESGWGTSRFAVKANNYFGIWCFRSGCGLKPQSRDEGMNHEVASYDSVQDSVRAYMHNINTHRAYRDLRTIRSEQRHLQNHYMGLQLTDGLRHYSELGPEYVHAIKQMIRVNRLQEYTLPSSA